LRKKRKGNRKMSKKLEKAFVDDKPSLQEEDKKAILENI
jgi:hypothetical protein